MIMRAEIEHKNANIFAQPSSPVSPATQKPAQYCSVAAAMSILGGRWKPLILKQLASGPSRFGTLLRSLPGGSHQALTLHLRQLERDGIIKSRRRKEGKVLTVEYSLTAAGLAVLPALDLLSTWAKRFLPPPATGWEL